MVKSHVPLENFSSHNIPGRHAVWQNVSIVQKLKTDCIVWVYFLSPLKGKTQDCNHAQILTYLVPV